MSAGLAAAGDILLQQGEEAHFLHFIISGTVRVYVEPLDAHCGGPSSSLQGTIGSTSNHHDITGRQHGTSSSMHGTSSSPHSGRGGSGDAITGPATAVTQPVTTAFTHGAAIGAGSMGVGGQSCAQVELGIR